MKTIVITGKITFGDMASFGQHAEWLRILNCGTGFLPYIWSRACGLQPVHLLGMVFIRKHTHFLDLMIVFYITKSANAFVFYGK